MVGLNRQVRRRYENRDSIDNLAFDCLKNNFKRLSDEWYEWELRSGNKVQILKVLDGYEGNDNIQTDQTASSTHVLPSQILMDCKKRLDEEEIKDAVNKIIEILRGENYPKLDFDYPKNLNQEEKNLIKAINDSSPFKEHKIGEAIELCISKEILSDEPLGCYVRPGILKVKHNAPEFVDHPKIVLYKNEIVDFAKSKNINQEYIIAFVYLYQLCRVYFDRYPYGNLLEYQKWDIRMDGLQKVVQIDEGKIQDCIVRDDKVSSIERPVVALVALHYADQIDKDVLEAGKIILSDEELYKNWNVLSKWNKTGIGLFENEKTELIETFRDVAILIISDDDYKDMESLLQDKAMLMPKKEKKPTKKDNYE